LSLDEKIQSGVFISNKENGFNDLLKLCGYSAHQLNNRLTTILANTQLALLMMKDESLKRYLKAAEEAARDAGMIVRSFQESTQAMAKNHIEK